jgi:hypothetical protein
MCLNTDRLGGIIYPSSTLHGHGTALANSIYVTFVNCSTSTSRLSSRAIISCSFRARQSVSCNLHILIHVGCRLGVRCTLSV